MPQQPNSAIHAVSANQEPEAPLFPHLRNVAGLRIWRCSGSDPSKPGKRRQIPGLQQPGHDKDSILGSFGGGLFVVQAINNRSMVMANAWVQLPGDPILDPEENEFETEPGGGSAGPVQSVAMGNGMSGLGIVGLSPEAQAAYQQQLLDTQMRQKNYERELVAKEAQHRRELEIAEARAERENQRMIAMLQAMRGNGESDGGGSLETVRELRAEIGRIRRSNEDEIHRIEDRYRKDIDDLRDRNRELMKENLRLQRELETERMDAIKLVKNEKGEVDWGKVISDNIQSLPSLFEAAKNFMNGAQGIVPPPAALPPG